MTPIRRRLLVFAPLSRQKPVCICGRVTASTLTLAIVSRAKAARITLFVRRPGRGGHGPVAPAQLCEGEPVEREVHHGCRGFGGEALTPA
jgi:hypothetical protein